jgi:hypothetical protein
VAQLVCGTEGTSFTHLGSQVSTRSTILLSLPTAASNCTNCLVSTHNTSQSHLSSSGRLQNHAKPPKHPRRAPHKSSLRTANYLQLTAQSTSSDRSKSSSMREYISLDQLRYMVLTMRGKYFRRTGRNTARCCNTAAKSIESSI